MVTTYQYCTLCLAGLTHDTRVRCLPAFGLQILANLQHHVFVFWMRHLLVDPEVVACLIVWLDRKVLGVRRIHPVNINIHYVDC